MARVANSWLFRAEAMRLNWVGIGARLLPPYFTRTRASDGEWAARLKERSHDLHVWWACAQALGVPREPFVVWTRQGGDKLRRVKATVTQQDDGLLLGWGGVEAAAVEVTFRQGDPKLPSALFAFRTGGSLLDTVGSAVAAAGSPAPTTLRIRCSGATSAKLVNGAKPSVSVQALEEVINDPSWKPLELVGLPCEQPWTGTVYDSKDQGPVVAPRPPIEAAVDRLLRGAPPIGWAPLTQAGRLAPQWQGADPRRLVKEVLNDLLPEVVELYAAATPEYRQYLLEHQRLVDGPQQDGRTSSLETSATLRPWSLLALPAQTDPLLNLATGFGATYFAESGQRPELSVGGSDFLVTARFKRPPPPLKGEVTLAAYAPQVGPHIFGPPPTNLRAERSGLVAPSPVDTPWRESLRLSWDRLPVTAAIGRVGAGALARYDLGASQAESLLPTRDAGGWRPLTLSPDGPAGTPGNARVAFADAAANIPILGGGRRVGYAVSVVDIHGVWSPWRDVAYAGDEPGPLPPRLISVALDSTYAGSPTCPATLRLEAALDWIERTPTALEIVAIYFPQAAAASPPPAGLDPALPAPAGCFRRDLGLTFAGNVPTGVGCAVESMAQDGEAPMAPGPGQGDGGRRYQLTAAVPSLDFSATGRWGVQVWLRSRLLVGASPTGYAPDAAHPARAVAASPVPVIPLPPPLPPGVPMGSTPDAQGRSHVRVQWSMPAGGDVRSCVVWEIAESSLRQRAGLPARAPDTDSPGVRLAALWAAYDAMSETQQRAAFRRLQEVDGAVRSVDVPLPKGSSDIHLFTVTTQSMTGIESPWPGPAATGHLHLQAVVAPRLRRPAPPVARAVVNEDGSVTLSLQAASKVPVARFLVFATRSEAAARDWESMGPAIVSVPVVAAPVATDPVTNAPIYQAAWTGTLAASWDPWLVRVVAQPVDTVPLQAVRGVPSSASEITSLVALPSGAPDLEPLTAEVRGADHRGVVVRSSTSAPARATAAGSHRLSAVAGTTLLPLVALEALPETPGTTAPSGAAPTLERGARAGGRSPLVLWFKRPVAADPVDVTLRLVDPMGRATERSLTVPGWVPPPAWHLTVVALAVRSKGIIFGVDTDAPTAVKAGVVMTVGATRRSRLLGPSFARIARASPAGLALRAGLVRPDVRGPDLLRAALLRVGLAGTLEASFPLATIPSGKPLFPEDGRIHVVRLARVGQPPPPRYAVWVPLEAPFTVEVTLTDAAGGRVTASVRV